MKRPQARLNKTTEHAKKRARKKSTIQKVITPKTGGTVYLVDINQKTHDSVVYHAKLYKFYRDGKTADVQLSSSPGMLTAVDTRNLFTTHEKALLALQLRLKVCASDIALDMGKRLGKISSELDWVERALDLESKKARMFRINEKS